MKKLVSFLAILTSLIFFSQSPTKFEFTSQAMNPFIVTEIDNKTAPEIYQNAIAWLKKNYNSPDDAIITTIENDYIRFQGISKGLSKVKALGITSENDVKYTVEVSVKDNKYKFELLKIEEAKDNFGDHLDKIANSGTSRNVAIRKYWEDITPYLLTNSELDNYKRKGSGYIKKDGTVKSQWKNYIQLFPEYFNNLNLDLKNYILGNSEKSNKDW